MKKLMLLVLLTCFGIDKPRAQPSDQILIGSQYAINSDILNENREYWISLPDSYQEDAPYKNYPVLVLLDGNVHFKSISGTVNYLSSDLYRSWKIPEMIVVGIVNVDRRRDYTPDKVITKQANTSGGGEAFLRFLEEELLPHIDQTYRTAPYRILFGHSLGGLLATHAYMKESSSFNSFIVVDPSFGTWDAETMDGKLDAVSPKSFERYLYLATANWGKRNFNNRDRHIRLFEGLHSKSNDFFRAKFEYFEEENHASVPVAAFHRGISAIYEGYGISYRDIDNSAQMIQHFKDISRRLSYEIKPPEHLVNQLGNASLKADKAKSLEYFMLNTANYPASYRAFNTLAEAYEAVGNPEKALENYKISLKLNPKNNIAQERIAQLDSK